MGPQETFQGREGKGEMNGAKRMKRVEIIAEVGTSFGIVRNDDFCITISVRPPGQEDWPHEIEPVSGFNTIREGFTRYAVMEDDDETIQGAQ
jgi:hypothetical protein